MITLRRAGERLHDQRRKQETWHTFCPRGRANPLADGFGAFENLSENRLPPGGVCATPPPQESEIVTYVYKGALAQEDSTGSSGVVRAGEFQRMTSGRAIRHKETNPSRTDWAHTFRISLRPTEVGLKCSHEQMRFAAARRHDVMCVVASPDGRSGSLCLLQDAIVCSTILDPGRHMIHELMPGRCAWIHVICGEATLQDLVLTRGDGVGVTMERSVSLTAREECEILLVDLSDQGSRPPES